MDDREDWIKENYVIHKAQPVEEQPIAEAKHEEQAAPDKVLVKRKKK